jgi:hypothetical protein
MQSSQVIQDRAVRLSAQCPGTFSLLAREVPHSALYFMSGIAGAARSGTSHSSCSANTPCVAFSIKNDLCVTRHAVSNCDCRHVQAPRTKLVQILSSGKIPILRCTRAASGSLVLDYEAAYPRLDYVAISHVWADGLGNPEGNSVPACQIERIIDMVQSMDDEWDHWGHPLRELYTGVRATCRSSMSTARALKDIPGKLPYTIRIWLDVYCVPLERPVTLFEDTVNHSSEEYTG